MSSGLSRDIIHPPMRRCHNVSSGDLKSQIIRKPLAKSCDGFRKIRIAETSYSISYHDGGDGQALLTCCEYVRPVMPALIILRRLQQTILLYASPERIYTRTFPFGDWNIPATECSGNNEVPVVMPETTHWNPGVREWYTVTRSWPTRSPDQTGYKYR